MARLLFKEKEPRGRKETSRCESVASRVDKYTQYFMEPDANYCYNMAKG